MPEFYTVCRETDLIPGTGKTVEVGGKLIAVFLDNGRYFAIDDVCPHMGASLAEGSLDLGIVTCPWHGWKRAGSNRVVNSLNRQLRDCDA